MFWPQVSYNVIQIALLIYQEKYQTTEWKLLQLHDFKINLPVCAVRQLTENVGAC